MSGRLPSLLEPLYNDNATLESIVIPPFFQHPEFGSTFFSQCESRETVTFKTKNSSMVFMNMSKTFQAFPCIILLYLR